MKSLTVLMISGSLCRASREKTTLLGITVWILGKTVNLPIISGACHHPIMECNIPANGPMVSSYIGFGSN
jgi:hypothetical protein